MTTHFRCTGCGASPAPDAHPFRCDAATPGDDIDHVLARTPSSIAAPPPAQGSRAQSANPFVRYRYQLSAYWAARSHGMSDSEYLDLVERLDAAIALVDGHGFVETPFARHDELAARLGFEDPGELWVKDETGNVSGSHKARHLAGIMLYLLAAERAGTLSRRTPLAIASCGNAALAAAVVASAAGWPLQVFVPPAANAFVLARLSQLGADVATCYRESGATGDPCYRAFRQEVSAGAIPFCCQGSDNGLTIEGGETLAWEMAERVPSLDAVFVQVGGGALASAVAQGFGAARDAGVIARLPRLHAVQTAGGFPLARAFDLAVARIVSRWPEAEEPPTGSPGDLARAIASEPSLVDDAMTFARGHRSQFMWPWEEEPRSVAHGILDDETYDWAAVVDGMLRTAGRAIVVGEGQLEAANAAARAATGVDADHTGTAGLAGLMDALEHEPDLRRSRVAVIFSGARRR